MQYQVGQQEGVTDTDYEMVPASYLPMPINGLGASPDGLGAVNPMMTISPLARITCTSMAQQNWPPNWPCTPGNMQIILRDWGIWRGRMGHPHDTLKDWFAAIASHRAPRPSGFPTPVWHAATHGFGGCGCTGISSMNGLGVTTSTGPNPTVVALGGLVATASAAASAYHGYKRNNSVGWAVAWGLLGGLFPIITPAIAVAQGYGKPAKGK